MGALVTLDLPAPAESVPWIITFGPLSDEDEWDAVVCGPYERPHAMAIAEEIVADEDMMAVVEPLLPHVDVAAIRDEIAMARARAQGEEDVEGDVDIEVEDIGMADEEPDESGYAGAPDPEEVRAGFVRIAAHLTER